MDSCVWLNGVRYPIVGEVIKRRTTPLSPAFRTGAATYSDMRPLETWVIGPLKGGMGQEKWEPGTDDRYWYGVDVDCSRNLMTLAPLVTTLGAFGVAPERIIQFQDKIWAIGHQEIAYWNDPNWTTGEPATALDNPTDALVYYSVVPTTQTFHPDASPESTSVDGYVDKLIPAGDTWANLHDAATGTSIGDNANELKAYILADDTNNEWERIYRSILVLDLSDIPSTATIISATLSLHGYTKTNTFSAATPTLNVYASTPASNTAVATADFNQIGTTAYCDTAITYANFSLTGYNDFAFNSTGTGAITTALAGDGILKLGLREATYDAADSAPTWESEKAILFSPYAADAGAPYEPKLVVTYTVASTYSECLCVASASGRSVKTSSATGATWSPLAKTGGGALDATYLAEFENRLCALAASNKGFRYTDSHDIYSDWTDKPNFPNLPEDFTGLFTAKDKNDNPVLYALTNSGVYALDVFDNFYTYPSEVMWARDSTAGKAALYAKGDKYVAVGGTRLLKISGSVITEWGPDIDDGLPETLQGDISAIINVGYWIIIAIDGGTANYSCILKRYMTKPHWQVVHVGSATNKRIKAICWDDGTLYFGEHTSVMSLPLSSRTDNYKHLAAHTYAASGTLYTSKFRSPFESMKKVAHEIHCIGEDIDDDDKITMTYRTDGSSSYINTGLSDSGVFDSSPRHAAITFGTNAVGLEFEDIQLAAAFARAAGTTTNSPKVERFELKYRVIPPDLEGWQFRANCRSIKDRTGKSMIDALETARATSTLLAFYPKGEVKAADVKYVQIVGDFVPLEGTEYGMEGEYLVSVEEVRAD